MLKKILIVLCALVLILVIVVALRPNAFRVERSIVIPAPPAAVFPHINDLHLFQAWSPWAKLDPMAKTTFNGTPAGPGSSFHWVGNSQIGEGTMTLTESDPDKRIGFRLDFLKPFKGTNTAAFVLTPEAGGTRVNWSMSGNYNFVTKAIGLVMNMENMIGGQFEQGLADLKTICSASR